VDDRRFLMTRSDNKKRYVITARSCEEKTEWLQLLECSGLSSNTSSSLIGTSPRCSSVTASGARVGSTCVGEGEGVRDGVPSPRSAEDGKVRSAGEGRCRCARLMLLVVLECG
jgi:hypothetical protein